MRTKLGIAGIAVVALIADQVGGQSLLGVHLHQGPHLQTGAGAQIVDRWVWVLGNGCSFGKGDARQAGAILRFRRPQSPPSLSLPPPHRISVSHETFLRLNYGSV